MTIFIISEPQYTAWKEMGIIITTTLYAKLAAKNSESRRIEPARRSRAKESAAVILRSKRWRVFTENRAKIDKRTQQ
jgi:hypothetical protein